VLSNTVYVFIIHLQCYCHRIIVGLSIKVWIRVLYNSLDFRARHSCANRLLFSTFLFACLRSILHVGLWCGAIAEYVWLCALKNFLLDCAVCTQVFWTVTKRLHVWGEICCSIITYFLSCSLVVFFKYCIYRLCLQSGTFFPVLMKYFLFLEMSISLCIHVSSCGLDISYTVTRDL